MYLSCLLINVGANPDRPRPGRLWLRNVYRVHQRLCMAFPSNDRKERDPDFLLPYAPSDFADGDVHVSRSPKGGFLFRMDPQPGGNPVIVVQSASRPNWDYAFHNAQYLLAAKPEVRCYDPQFGKGQHLRFRLKANPTRRASKNSRHPSGEPIGGQWIGKRIPVPVDGLKNWLDRCGERCGFRVTELTNTITGYVYFNETGEKGKSTRLCSALLEGTLEVVDPGAFANTVVAGVGREKAFGFGLLTVHPT